MFPTNERSSVYRTQDQSLIVSRTGSEACSPRGTVYESVTIKKQYDQYMEIKEGTLRKSSRVLRMSYCFMLAFSLYLLLTVVSIFVDTTPIMVLLSLTIANKDTDDVSSGSMGNWVVRLFNVVNMLVYLSQMVFTLYHRGTLKVNTSLTLRSIAQHHAIIFTVSSAAFYLINIIFFVMSMDGSGSGSALWVLLVLLSVTSLLQIGLFFGFWWLANDSVR